MPAVSNAVRRLLTPSFFCVDFTHPAWALSTGLARGSLVLATSVDLGVQWLAGEPAWWTLLLSALAPLVCWWLPPRLMTALANLTLIQAPGGLLLVRGLEHLATSPDTIASSLMGWQLCGVIALLALLLRYIRTPRSTWRG